MGTWTKKQRAIHEQVLQEKLKADPELREEVSKLRRLRAVIFGREKPDAVAEETE